MTITLSPDQLAWIEARVARGEYGDVDEAVRSLLAEAIAERDDVEDDAMAWAKPLVDQALAEIERGEAISLEEFEARIDARMAALGE